LSSAAANTTKQQQHFLILSSLSFINKSARHVRSITHRCEYDSTRACTSSRPPMYLAHLSHDIHLTDTGTGSTARALNTRNHRSCCWEAQGMKGLRLLPAPDTAAPVRGEGFW
jgi:hypothetical protein